MSRRTVCTLAAPLLAAVGILGAAPAAQAASTTQLVLSQGAAFRVIGYDCGGIREHVYATGFASNGYPIGAAHLETTCSSGGRGGGHFTVKGWASVVWTWFGETRSYTKLEAEPPGLSTSFSSEDAHGDRVYNTETAAYLETTSPPIVAPEAPTNVSAYAYRTGEEGESGPQRFSIGWTPAPETAGLLTSSTVTARPVGSSAPTLTATVAGTASGVQLGTAEPNTTYLITVTNTDAEGTSAESAPFEARTLTPVAEEFVPPFVSTEPPGGVSETTATLEGYVNPRGEEVGVCTFEYGTTEEYGASVACSSSPGEGEIAIPVSAPLAGLAPATTYHYRLVAASPGGTSYGADQSFTTLSNEPPPVLKKVAPRSGSPAGGTVVTITGTGLGAANAVHFESSEAHIVAINSASSVTVEAPAGTPGSSVNVTVTTPAGTSAITSKDRFRYKRK